MAVLGLMPAGCVDEIRPAGAGNARLAKLCVGETIFENGDNVENGCPMIPTVHFRAQDLDRVL